MKTLMIFALSLGLGGCAARKARGGNLLSVPGCGHAYAYVPRGCYGQTFADRVEVRCPETTIVFRKCVNR